jgi:Flp pilus assembly protein TadD
VAGELDRTLIQAKNAHRSGRFQKAKDLYQKYLKARPDDSPAALALGDVCMHVEDFDAAAKLYASLLEGNPKQPVVLSNLGAALLRLGKPADARAVLEFCLELDPKNIYARINLGGVLQSQGEPKRALENALEAVSIDPTHPLAFNNLGSALSDLAMFNEAKHAYETAVMLNPKNVDALINLAGSESKLCHNMESADLYEKVLAMLPPEAAQRAEAVKFFAAFEYLNMGMLEKGWDYYEGGFSPLVPLNGARSPNRQFDVPRWQGGPLNGKTLLLWAEQGVGDEMNFGTCLPEMDNIDGSVILEVDYRLVDIFQRSFPRFLVRPTAFNPTTMKPLQAGFDYHLPFASLHRLYRRTIESFSRNKPFLKPNPVLVSEFKRRISKKPGDLLIGICWRSGLLSPTRNMGYMKIDELEQVFKIPSARVVNLQYGDPEPELIAAEQKFGIQILRWADVDYKYDLDKVFAIIQNLDVVFSVGSAPLCMAGSIGKLSLTLSPIGCWQNFGKKDPKANLPWFRDVFFEPRHSENLALRMQELVQAYETR